MQEFFTNTIQSNFIKALVYNTPLPEYKTIRVEDFIVAGTSYIYKNNIIKCTKSGKLGRTALYEYIGQYDFGQEYNKLTSRYMSKYSYYDSETHQHLGELLRCYRDILGIDLMPFYNCFSGEYYTDIAVTSTGVVSASNNQDYKIIKIPIKYNTTYTIALDSNSQVYIAPALIAHGVPIAVSLTQDILADPSLENTPDLTTQLCSDRTNIQRYNSMSFRAPVTYKLENTDDSDYLIYKDTSETVIKKVSRAEFFERYEKNLFLLIQIPVANTSSIVVLEGDYTKAYSQKIFNYDNIDDISEKKLDSMLLTKLSLLQFNDNKNHPYANRLIEFLLENVITDRDELSEDIDRVQEEADVKGFARIVESVWNPYLRAVLFSRYYKNKHTINQDITGYVDKDIENYLLKGVE